MRYELFPGAAGTRAHALSGAGQRRLFRRICNAPGSETGTVLGPLGYHWRFPVDD